MHIHFWLHYSSIILAQIVNECLMMERAQKFIVGTLYIVYCTNTEQALTQIIGKVVLQGYTMQYLHFITLIYSPAIFYCDTLRVRTNCDCKEQIGSGAQPASHKMVTEGGGDFPSGKALRA
jgi:hypothetical protein